MGNPPDATGKPLDIQAPSEPLEWALLATAAFGLLLVLSGLLRSIATGKCGVLLGCVATFFRELLPRERLEDQKMMSLVQERLWRQAARHVCSQRQVLGVCMLGPVLTLAMHRAMGLRPETTPLQDLCFFCLQAFFATSLPLPDMVTPRSLDFFCSIPLLGSAAMVSPWLCPPQAHGLAFSFGTTIATTSLLSRRTTPTPTRCLFFASLLLYKLSLMLTVLSRRERLAPAYFIPSAVCLLVSRAIDRGVERTVIATLQQEHAEKLSAAGDAILRSCCDVVVELDAHGAVASTSRDLGSLLLRDGRALRGMPLVDLSVLQEERKVFQERLFAPVPDDAAMAESMHITVRDGNNSLLRLEVLWFRYGDIWSSGFLAGLRECEEQPLRALVASRVEDSVPEIMPINSDSSTGSVSRDPRIVLDCTQPGFPVQSVSSSFIMRMGRLPEGAMFVNQLQDPTAFEGWLKAGLLRQKRVKGGCKQSVLLQMRIGKFLVRTQCYLEDIAEVVDLSHVALVFRCVQCRRSRELSQEVVARPGWRRVKASL